MSFALGFSCCFVLALLLRSHLVPAPRVESDALRFADRFHKQPETQSANCAPCQCVCTAAPCSGGGDARAATDDKVVTAQTSAPTNFPSATQKCAPCPTLADLQLNTEMRLDIVSALETLRNAKWEVRTCISCCAVMLHFCCALHCERGCYLFCAAFCRILNSSVTTCFRFTCTLQFRN